MRDRRRAARRSAARSSQPTLLTGVTARHAGRPRGDVRPARPGHPRSTTEDEAIAIANDTEFGLAALLLHAATSAGSWRVGEALEFGVVGVNTGLISYEGAPFGGVKESGHRAARARATGSRSSLEVKYLCIDGI